MANGTHIIFPVICEKVNCNMDNKLLEQKNDGTIYKCILIFGEVSYSTRKEK